MGKQPTHISRAQLAKPSKGSGPGHREEGRENKTLPSNKTQIFLARKVKWLCRRIKPRDICPHWPDVNYKLQKHRRP